MTQRIFDVENEKDMADLWDILPDEVIKLTPSKGLNYFYGWYNDCGNTTINMLKINWHNKTEIHRPIKEASEADIDKICKFWDGNNTENYTIGLLQRIDEKNDFGRFKVQEADWWQHCRRLTKQEIKELC